MRWSLTITKGISMSAYTNHQGVELVWYIVDQENLNTFRTTKPLIWHVGSLDGPVVTVPDNFVFDVSVPKIFHCIFNPNEIQYLKAAALHDYMLSELKWNRLTAAGEFHQALLADKVSKWRRIAMFLATAFYKFH